MGLELAPVQQAAELGGTTLLCFPDFDRTKKKNNNKNKKKKMKKKKIS